MNPKPSEPHDTLSATPLSGGVAAPAGSTDSGDSQFGAIGIAICLILLVGALAAGFLLSSRARPRSTPDFPTPAAPSLTDFSLIDRTGRSVTRKDLDEKFVVVSFVFTSCGVSCLDITRRMVELNRRLTNQADVRFLSITVDPRTDTSSVLLRFAERLGAADTNRWFFLTGDPASVFKFIDASLLPGFESPTSDPYLKLDGPTRIGLIDRRGRMRGYFDGFKARTPESIDAMIQQLRKEELQ